ncbi:LRR receptor-like serine threonine-protein kinase [Seminavis robusta]|uniref:LRR receptor-like serine threonine-protein kinase n=1 Tax=Seminavis robusta TaxID=568900 RepID=A0A9N8HEB7_9STRA|nr:LRR receptor-like serine threonine-protein kinase [Seminavis robusta]|eukprot:Sro380_g130700.1 LRR receptor-like serine threonine-protein kinase (855) ;mRNA; r:57824-60509
MMEENNRTDSPNKATFSASYNGGEDGEVKQMKDIRISVINSCGVLDDSMRMEARGDSGFSKEDEDSAPMHDQTSLKLGTIAAVRMAVINSCGVLDDSSNVNSMRMEGGGNSGFSNELGNNEQMSPAGKGEAECGADTRMKTSRFRDAHGQMVGIGVQNTPSRNPRMLVQSRPGAFPCTGILSPQNESSSGTTETEANTDVEAPTGDVTEMQRLSIANLVPEDDDRSDLQQAQAVDVNALQESNHERHEQRKILGLAFRVAGIGGILFFVIVLILSLWLRHEQQETAKPMSPEATGTQPPVVQTFREHIMSLLPSDTIAYVLQDHTIQHSAFQWLIQDPNINSAYSDARILQRFVLATFYLSTGGAYSNETMSSSSSASSKSSLSSWSNEDKWLSYHHHECDWWAHNTSSLYGVPEEQYNLLYNFSGNPCDSDGNYQHLWLWQNGLRGNLPPELYLLTNLCSITIDRNELAGTISSQIGHLRELEALALFRADLTGTLPSEVGLLTQLSFLWLMSNENLGGTIPSEYGQLSKLQYFLVDSASLTGSIPTEVGNLSDLIWLFLYDNELTGSFPTEMGRMQALDTLWIWMNEISGPIPSEFGLLGKTLGHMAIDVNPLEGSLPTELGRLSTLTLLHVSDSKLTGTLPTELGLLGNLTSVTINTCDLSGTLPSEVGLLTNAFRFWSWNTHFTGTIPTEFGHLAAMETMAFDDNGLVGSLPSELGLLSNLSHLYFTANMLTSSVPTEMGQLSKLDGKLWLQSNQLTGPIPSELGLLQNVSELLLHDNRFTGSVPFELGSLEQLKVLAIFNNSELKGTIPPSLCILTSWDTPAIVESNQGGIQVDCEKVECPCVDICVCS